MKNIRNIIVTWAVSILLLVYFYRKFSEPIRVPKYIDYRIVDKDTKISKWDDQYYLLLDDGSKIEVLRGTYELKKIGDEYTMDYNKRELKSLFAIFVTLGVIVTVTCIIWLAHICD